MKKHLAWIFAHAQKRVKYVGAPDPGRAITSDRSIRLRADFSYEDSSRCVAGEEEGGSV